MLWTIEMQNSGVFEAETTRKVIQKIINYYSDSETLPRIKSIYVINKNDDVEQLCSDAVLRLQNILDEKISKNKKISDQEYLGQKEIESQIGDAIYG